MKKLLLFCFLLVIVGLQAEIRSVWALPWDINSPEAIDALIQTALDNRQNELLVEVRYRADALYDPTRGDQQYPNPEPRSYVLNNDGFDPLSYVLEKGHAANLKVQAWVIVFNATPTDANLMRRNYLYQNHPDWLTMDSSGNRSNSAIQYGNYLDPGIPEVQSYLLDVFSNLASGYPELDGIHLDYIRYPEPSKGCHPISVERYKEYCRNQQEISFNEWRIMQVSGFVEKLYLQLKQINPRLLISAAVFADIAEANVAYAQDWPSWLRGGYIDRIYPMAYNVKYEKHKQQVSQMKLLNRDKDIVIGLRAWDDKGRSLASNGSAPYKVADIAKRIQLTRELGFGGTALFSYAGLKIGNAWPQLKQFSFNEETQIDSLNLHSQADSTATARISVSDYRNEYVMDLQIPSEGNWRWEIRDADLVYQRYRYYQQGENRDFWNGQLYNAEKSKQQLSPGQYVLHLYREDASYKYLIPLQFEALGMPSR